MTLFPKENWTRIAGLLGAAAVGLGAYGAHGLQNITPEQKRQYDTANYYHFLHTLGLAVVPLSKRPILTGTLMLLGTTLFSGTIYYNIFTGKDNLKRLTPYGGMILIISWLTMI
ncbi:transmembrane protein 256 homolog [Lepeophtheirus salmonis]|uniref:transmembrane protein 256 homolog n=1 Tax=Lepeophtheirus salmonis TaxID=72036 RepID=UPI003AF3BB82